MLMSAVQQEALTQQLSALLPACCSSGRTECDIKNIRLKSALLSESFSLAKCFDSPSDY